MASVDYKKIKTKADAAALIRHCDTDERLEHNHSNEEIDKSETENNLNLYSINYLDVLKKIKERIQYLDDTTNTNKRKDRVEMFSLIVPSCENMSIETSKEFLNDALKIIENVYDKKNIMNAYLHVDEIHEYIDDFKIKKSRPHLHIYIIASDHEGKLNGKWFSSKAMMKKVNKEIDDLARNKYNERFMTHEKAKKKTVEQLKSQTQDIKNIEKFNELLQKNLFEELRKMLKNKRIMKTVLAALEANREEKNRDMNGICR